MSQEMEIGDTVTWSGYGGEHSGEVTELDHDDGHLLVLCPDGIPWQARKVDGIWQAYSGDNTFTFPLSVGIQPT